MGKLTIELSDHHLAIIDRIKGNQTSAEYISNLIEEAYQDAMRITLERYLQQKHGN